MSTLSFCVVVNTLNNYTAQTLENLSGPCYEKRITGNRRQNTVGQNNENRMLDGQTKCLGVVGVTDAVKPKRDLDAWKIMFSHTGEEGDLSIHCELY